MNATFVSKILGGVPVITGFRWLAYAITPGETSFEDPAEVPRYIDKVVPFFLISIVLEIIVCQLTGKRGLRINDSLSSMSAGLISTLPQVIFRPIEIVAYCWVWNNLRLVELAWNSTSTWWLCFIGVDFGYYWFHRFAHEINIFWAAHQVHHSSEHYNLSTALRQSVLQRYTSWLFYLPMALVVPCSMFMVHMQFNIMYQFWIHTETIKSLGPLEWILNTPSHHRVHHGRNPYCIDKNYAGTLIIWDRLFGTFAPEKEEVAYGLVHNVNAWDPFYVQFFHLRNIWRKSDKMKNIRDKLSAIFNGPGWYPGTPRLGNPEDLPEIELPVQVYNRRVSMWMDLYLSVQLLLSLVWQRTIKDLYTTEDVSAITVFLTILYILYTLHCIGGINDVKTWAPFAELSRCVMYIVADITFNGGTDRGQGAVLLQIVYLMSAGYWCLQSFKTLFGTGVFCEAKDKENKLK